MHRVYIEVVRGHEPGKSPPQIHSIKSTGPILVIQPRGRTATFAHTEKPPYAHGVLYTNTCIITKNKYTHKATTPTRRIKQTKNKQNANQHKDKTTHIVNTKHSNLPNTAQQMKLRFKPWGLNQGLALPFKH